MKIQVLLFTLISSFAVIKASAQTQEEIINRHIKQVGDASKWKQIKTIQFDGKIIDGNTFIKFSRKIKAGTAMRYDYSFETRNKMFAGKKYLAVHSPKGSWKSAPEDTGLVKKMTDFDIKLAKEEMIFEDPFVSALQSEAKIIRQADENFNEKNHFKFLVAFPNGKSYYYYIESKSYHIVRRVLLNADIDQVLEYDNYIKTKIGVSLPGSIFANELETKIESVKINETFNENIFTFKP